MKTQYIDTLSYRKQSQTSVINAGMQITQLGFRFTLFLGVLLLIIVLIPKSDAYSDKRPAKIATWYEVAQNEFISDMKKGKHDHPALDLNKCDTINSDTGKPFSLAALVFAFDYNESKNGTVGQSIKTHNWSSLHPNGSYYYMWDGESKSVSEESLRIYKHPIENMKDTMYLLKYGYGCNIDWDHIAYYIYGSGPYNKYVPHLEMTRSEHVTIYRERLIEKAKAYEKERKSKK